MSRILVLLFLSAFLQFQSAEASLLATDWITHFDLTDSQKNLLERWAQEARYSDAFILRAARAFENQNNRPRVYIPEHTPQDLTAVINWAAGTAYAMFARQAGYHFDYVAYEQDCPHRALYNFGYATETLHLRQDVLQKFFRSFNLLDWQHRIAQSAFSQFYFEQAQKEGFEKYLTPIEDNLQISSL